MLLLFMVTLKLEKKKDLIIHLTIKQVQTTGFGPVSRLVSSEPLC